MANSVLESGETLFYTEDFDVSDDMESMNELDNYIDEVIFKTSAVYDRWKLDLK